MPIKNVNKVILYVLAKIFLQVILYVPDGEKSGVSSPIRSIKMYSCVLCAMQEKSVCCRDVPCLVHTEQGPDPRHPGHPPPSLICLATGDLVY
jgi:hypothetical protein